MLFTAARGDHCITPLVSPTIFASGQHLGTQLNRSADPVSPEGFCEACRIM